MIHSRHNLFRPNGEYNLNIFPGPPPQPKHPISGFKMGFILDNKSEMDAEKQIKNEDEN